MWENWKPLKKGRKKIVCVCQRYVYIHVKIHLLRTSCKLIVSDSKSFVTYDSFLGQTSVGVTSKRAGEWTVFVSSFLFVIVTVPFCSGLSSLGPAKLSRWASTLLGKHWPLPQLQDTAFSALPRGAMWQLKWLHSSFASHLPLRIQVRLHQFAILGSFPKMLYNESLITLLPGAGDGATVMLTHTGRGGAKGGTRHSALCTSPSSAPCTRNTARILHWQMSSYTMVGNFW